MHCVRSEVQLLAQTTTRIDSTRAHKLNFLERVTETQTNEMLRRK